MKLKKWILPSLLALLLVLAALVLHSTFALQTTHYTVTSQDLPQSFDGFRIAHVSDLHNEEFGTGNIRLLAAIRAENPDIIVVTGDLLDSYHTDLEKAAAFMEEAVKIAPCYFVPGNHEKRLPTETLSLYVRLKACGVKILEDQAVQLERGGQAITIAGLQDYPSLTMETLEAAFHPDGYTILLSHRPEHFELYAQTEADLVFSGHAHGGQLRLPFIGALYVPNQGLFPRYTDGMHTENGTTIVISRGLGNSSIPIRFLNPPELVIVELRR